MSKILYVKNGKLYRLGIFGEFSFINYEYNVAYYKDYKIYKTDNN